MIYRQSRFQTGILRTTPSGPDRVTAAAVRCGCLRITSQGMIWLPLGSRLVDRIRSLLRCIQTERGTLVARGDLAASAVMPLVGMEPRSYRDLPLVLSAETMPIGEPVGDLSDPDCLGALEWGAAAESLESAEEALADVEQDVLRVLRQCGADPQVAFGGPARRDWFLLSVDGSTALLRCSGCSATSEADMADFALPPSPPAIPESLREVATPGAKTIRLLCEQLGIQPSSTLKALFLTTAEGDTLLALMRGDLEASPTKLRQVLGTADVRPAVPEEVRRLPVAPGYAGPVGLPVRPTRDAPGVWVVGDRSILETGNLVTGANREGVHLAGVNFPRDFAVTEVVDIARAPRPAYCVACGGELVEARGSVLARRERFEGALAFAGQDGAQKRGSLVSLRLSLGSAVAGVIEAALRPDGMRFRPACAPFAVHVIVLPGGPDLTAVMETLTSHALDILIDDRDVSAGVKFAEADWIGSPALVVSGRKSAEAGGVELRRGEDERRIVAIEDLAAAILARTSEVM